MRRELAKRPRSGVPGTSIAWFAWCNVRPTPAMSGTFAKDQVNCANQAESGPGYGSALRLCPTPSPVFVVPAVEAGEVSVGFGEVERLGLLRIVLGPVFDG
ncbi:hypothetical protein Apa02nite_008050 [Actinoplanes palleronii]|uniref:Uncharacterized protein n=1 Tax=Actinoplanes palleronii TaxID=113570 RepID=A0ABQ4B210_9ACTN|nr:hypothetical protein Apa02nite_008050 [Actinoplanes palleronii]